MMNLQLRQTGRTTRMIERAVEYHANTKHLVIILMPTQQHAKLSQQDVYKTWHRLTGRPDFPNIRVDYFSDDWTGKVDWKTLRLIGKEYDNVLLLLDHMVVERRIEHIQGTLNSLIQQVKDLYKYTV